MLNISLVGAGFIGRVHARCIAANAATRLAAVYDLDEPAASALAARHGARVARSIGEITGSDETDAVVIASSTNSHGEIARACARAGKRFLCEKPLDTSFDAALYTMRSTRTAGIFAGIGFNRRFDLQYAALKRVVGAGKIGRVEMMHVTSRSQAPPTLDYVKTSGGQLRDKGSHFFDLACWIAGERPVEIYVAGACLIEPRFAEYGDVDTAMITLRMAGLFAISTSVAGRPMAAMNASKSSAQTARWNRALRSLSTWRCIKATSSSGRVCTSTGMSASQARIRRSLPRSSRPWTTPHTGSRG